MQFYRMEELKTYLERNRIPAAISEKAMRDMENVERMRTSFNGGSYLEIRGVDTRADTISGNDAARNEPYLSCAPECEEVLESDGFMFVRRVYVWDDAGDGAVVYAGGKKEGQGATGA